MSRLLPRDRQDWWGLDEKTVDSLRRGSYSDAYFDNTVRMLERLAADGYSLPGGGDLGPAGDGLAVGDVEVEMQFFTRRPGTSLVAGLDEALAVLRYCSGHFDSETREFVPGFGDLEVHAAWDGFLVGYDGDPEDVLPVLRVRGPYRLFGWLETVILGILSYETRVATNAHRIVEAANGKRVLFFPARFEHWRLQAQQGYAWSVAVARWNADHPDRAIPLTVSTDVQASAWHGHGAGTTSHATIAAFLGDTAEMMLRFAETMPPATPRVALVDFHNDCVAETLAVLRKTFARYREAVAAGDPEAGRYRLDGVRPDTSGSMEDASLVGTGQHGVTADLVWNLRRAIDGFPEEAAAAWPEDPEAWRLARAYCDRVEVTVTGGFTVDRIREFEAAGVPVAAYGVGSSMLENSSATGTNSDFTADVVRVRGNDGRWHDLAKTGRRARGNPDMARIRER